MGIKLEKMYLCVLQFPGDLTIYQQLKKKKINSTCSCKAFSYDYGYEKPLAYTQLQNYVNEPECMVEEGINVDSNFNPGSRHKNHGS